MVKALPERVTRLHSASFFNSDQQSDTITDWVFSHTFDIMHDQRDNDPAC
jgi:hypothetical protein